MACIIYTNGRTDITSYEIYMKYSAYLKSKYQSQDNLAAFSIADDQKFQKLNYKFLGL